MSQRSAVRTRSRSFINMWFTSYLYNMVFFHIILYIMFGILFYPIVLGVCLGIVLSVIINLYSKHPMSGAFMLFGISSKTIMTNIGLFLLSTIIVVLTGMAVMMQDWRYVLKYPQRFLIELICATILPSLLIIIMSYFRESGIPTYKTWLLFGGSCVEFGILHILMQFSGIYSIMIPSRLSI